MGHPIHRVTDFTVMAPYTIRVEFEDGLTRTIDFREILEGEMFGPLQDVALFNAVVLDAKAQTLVWPNGADFDPATRHDWPEQRAAMVELASGWAAAAHP